MNETVKYSGSFYKKNRDYYKAPIIQAWKKFFKNHKVKYSFWMFNFTSLFNISVFLLIFLDRLALPFKENLKLKAVKIFFLTSQNMLRSKNWVFAIDKKLEGKSSEIKTITNSSLYRNQLRKGKSHDWMFGIKNLSLKCY